MHYRWELIRPALYVFAVSVAASATAPLIAQIIPPPPPPTVITPPAPVVLSKLDLVLQLRAGSTGRSRVIVAAADATSLDYLSALVLSVGGTPGRRLPIINALAATVPNTAFAPLSNSVGVRRLSFDRPAAGAMERTGATVGAPFVRQELGLDGSGIGVAVIDSGVTPWHDDLLDPVANTQRVTQFVDLVNGTSTPYDDYGHGTHVAGIIGGNGFDSDGARAGIAPAATLLVVKVLDANGRGRISDMIAAFDYVVAHKSDFNIRVVNLSVATGVYESYDTDPLTVAARRVVDAGIVVVASAGNAGRDPQGNTQYVGITAPGNAPWVLTVGASSHMGTIDRADDTIAAFSSRGPSPVDHHAKPDLVAPGVGIESLSSPNSRLSESLSAYLLGGTVATSYPPYLSLSGTSMAAPVVTGTVALMLQANPALTPNAVKAILQYTAQVYPQYDALTEGSGFLNARGAVELARYFAAPLATPEPPTDGWSRHLVWGDWLVSGGRLAPNANAWASGLVWGATAASPGAVVTWGDICSANCDSGAPVWTAWHLDATSRNVVWGTSCTVDHCSEATPRGSDSSQSTTVVWGSTDEHGDTVVWGSDEASDTVVWGSNDQEDTVVWGSTCEDPSCRPVIWPRP